MAFSEEERSALLALKGVGHTVLARLQQMGLDSMPALAGVAVEDVLAAGAALSGSVCWRNSPQARAALTAVVELARARMAPP